jgi:Tfp pilus assembly protein PilE
MKNANQGFGGLQMIVVIAVVIGATYTAVPKYKSFMSKARLTEAFNLAGESKRKIAEFYMTNGRFPGTLNEAEAMMTTTVSAPKFVRDMAVVPKTGNHEVMVKVFLQEGVAENPEGVEQYIFIAGDQAAASGYALEWTCGGHGVDASLLPEECQI